MSENPTVNRYLTDKAMDRLDHALGRPLDPLGKTYRCYFAVGKDSDLAAEFRASPHWEEGREVPGGLASFHPTQEGRQALADHLKATGDPHRGYLVSFEGHTTMVVAKSRSGARYSYFLRISDCLPDMTFGDFVERCAVWVASPTRRSEAA